MSIFNDLSSKIRILRWVAETARHFELSVHCGLQTLNEPGEVSRANSFLALSRQEIEEKKQRLIAGQDPEFCRQVRKFLAGIAFRRELIRYQYLIALVPPADSEEYPLYLIFRDLIKKKSPFSIPEMGSLYFHHGLRFANQKIKDYVRDKVFIDAGAWEGDSASVFLQNYSPAKVCSFEISEHSAKKYGKIMKHFGFDRQSYELNLMALGADRKTLSFHDNGSLGCSIFNAGTKQIELIPLDEFMRKQKIPVGFIKADIEGCGLEMVKGAEEILKRDRPVLSLCIYHNPDEFFEIKPFIENLGLGYKFEIQHHSPILNLETVLFAYPEELTGRE